MSASVLEIYCEQIFDLLSGSRDASDRLDVREGPTGIQVPGLRIEAVSNMQVGEVGGRCTASRQTMLAAAAAIHRGTAQISGSLHQLKCSEWHEHGLTLPVQEVELVLAKGLQNRSTHATTMNEHSSRSHLIMSIFVTAKDVKTGALVLWKYAAKLFAITQPASSEQLCVSAS